MPTGPLHKGFFHRNSRVIYRRIDILEGNRSTKLSDNSTKKDSRLLIPYRRVIFATRVKSPMLKNSS